MMGAKKPSNISRALSARGEAATSSLFVISENSFIGAIHYLRSFLHSSSTFAFPRLNPKNRNKLCCFYYAYNVLL